MKTYLILLTLLITQQAFAQAQLPAEATQKPRIFFYPDEPAATTLIKAQLMLWPNPASTATSVRVENMTDQAVGAGYSMQVYASDGRLCQQQPWSAGEPLDVTRLAEGLYIVSVRKDNLLFTQKLLIKRK